MDRQCGGDEGDRWRLLVQGIADYALFLLDADGHVRAWNAGAEQVLGYAAGQVEGEHCSRLYPEDDVEQGRPQEQLEIAAALGRFEEDGWRLDGRGGRVWANVVIRPIHDEAGALAGFTTVLRDLARRAPVQDRVALVAERERIARELYGRTMRTLFGIGLQLNGVANRVDDPEVGQLLDRCVQELDEGIADLRRLAFDLGAARV